MGIKHFDLRVEKLEANRSTDDNSKVISNNVIRYLFFLNNYNISEAVVKRKTKQLKIKIHRRNVQILHTAGV